MNAAPTTAQQQASRTKRGLGILGLAAIAVTAAGCAVSYADTTAPVAHRATPSILGSLTGVTTSAVTSALPSTTSSQLMAVSAQAHVDGVTSGNLANLSQDAAWSLTLNEDIEGKRLGPLFGTESIAPFQVGDAMVVGLRSSVLNQAGTAVFSMRDGSLLWQDPSLECQRVDLGGALPCRQNSGAWAPLNPTAAVFGDAIDPGFSPEAFGFADGVLYSARTTGAGMIEVAAGTVAEPALYWTVLVPRAAEAMIPGQGAAITVGDTVHVVMGAAEVELTKDGQPLTVEAQPVQPADGSKVIDIAQSIGDVTVANTADDRVSSDTWSVPSRVVSDTTVTDGENLTFVAGDEADGTNVIRTISLVDGHTVAERGIVAGAQQPRDIQSAAHGLFAYDKQFSRIAYYPAG